MYWSLFGTRNSSKISSMIYFCFLTSKLVSTTLNAQKNTNTHEWAIKSDKSDAQCKKSIFSNTYTQALIRGIQQGDPILPYPLLIYDEGFSSILHHTQSLGSIMRCKIARQEHVISHLLFADNSFLFFKDFEHECSNVMECLRLYQRALGQLDQLQ